MGAKPHTLRGRRFWHGGIVGPAAVACVVLSVRTVASAIPLDQRIPGLFGGTLSTSISTTNGTEPQRLNLADQFRALSADLAAARSQAPIPSASGAFRFAWDPELDTFVRQRQSLGSGLAERAATLGARTGTFSVSYTHIDFDTLEGAPVNHLLFSQRAFSDAFLASKGTQVQARFHDDFLNTALDLRLSYDLIFFAAAYGITDSIDVSMALSLNRAHMAATVTTQIEKPDGSRGSGVLVNDQGEFASSSGRLCTPDDRKCATDGFSDFAVGTGDLFLRAKWHLYDTPYADLAVAGVLTLPTGNASDYLGFHDPTFTPWLIASKSFGRVSPHLDLGYSLRSGADVSQAEWIAGTDVMATRWLTLAADFLGFHDDKRDGINDDVLQSAIGFKINPFDQFVIGGSFQFPLNRDGVRADVIYTGQIEYTY